MGHKYYTVIKAVGSKGWNFYIYHTNGNLICFTNQIYKNKKDCEDVLDNMLQGIKEGLIEVGHRVVATPLTEMVDAIEVEENESAEDLSSVQ